MKALSYLTACLLCAVHFAPTFADEKLGIGSKAPPIDIEHWLQDKEPIAAFAAGQVYVIEFWATWCGPCVSSMPHLRDLQLRHSDELMVIGISDEDPDTINEVLEKETGDTPLGEVTKHYWLTTDPDKSVHDAYMKAAGQRGIPTAFIVGKTGVVEWIGHPMKIDEPVAKVLAGDWDREGYARQLEEQQEIARKSQAVFQKVQQKQYADALDMLDALIAEARATEVRTSLEGFRKRIKTEAESHAARQRQREARDRDSKQQVATVSGLIEMGFLLEDGDRNAALATIEQLLKANTNTDVRSLLVRARHKIRPRVRPENAVAAGLAVQPIARFTFDGHANNTAANKASCELRNTDFRDNALYLNGQYEHDGSKNGYRALCSAPDLDYTSFAVAIRFMAEEFTDRKNTILIGGQSHRWFGLSRSSTGTLRITLNNQRESHAVGETALEAGEWTVIACSVDLIEGSVLVSVNGEKPIKIALSEGFQFTVKDSPQQERDKAWLFTNYSNGQTFHGLVDELLVYDRSLSADELVCVPLAP